MSSIRLFRDDADPDTNVPNRFIREYLPGADGEFVKIYLFLRMLLSGSGGDCDISEIAKDCGQTETDVLRAIRYWEKLDLISLDYAEDQTTISAIHFLALLPEEPAPVGPDRGKKRDGHRAGTAPAASVPAAPLPSPDPGTQDAALTQTSGLAANVVPMHPARKEYSADDIRQFREDESVSELFFIIETYLKHPLNVTDTNTILYWYDALRLPTELIIYLVEYCIGKGHTSIRYMDKVAMNWSDSRITTVEQAREEGNMHSRIYYGVMKAFGISGRNLVDSEIALIRKWTNDYGFDSLLILEACTRTMSAIHQPSFEYTDSILTRWHENRVHDPSDIEKLDQEYNRRRSAERVSQSSGRTTASRFNNFSQREYDFDQLEKLALNTSVQ